jgi:hypothetical protein
MTKYYVSDTWTDTQGHYFNYDPNYQVWNALPVIQLDNPATGHKRSFEDTQTGYCYVHGWFWVTNVTIQGDTIYIEGYFGGYHGYDNTRANFDFVIGDPSVFDVTARPDLPYVRLHWTLSSLGWSNGSYGNYLSGYIRLTDPPEVSFSPANPSVAYNRITELVGLTVNVLFGYLDAWSADWDQWASASSDSYIDIPTAVAYVQEVSDAGVVAEAFSRTAKVTQTFTDTGKVQEYLEKTPLKTYRDAGKSLDFIEKGYGKTFTETITPSDYLSKSPSRNLFDYAVGEHSLRSLFGKWFKETVKAVDVFERTASFHIDTQEIGIPCDYLEKTPLKSLVDTSKTLDRHYKLVVKVYTDKTKSIEKFTKIATFTRTFTDTGKTAEYLRRDIVKRFVETSKVLDWYYKLVVKPIADCVVSLDWYSKDVSRVFTDTGKTTDYLRKTPAKRFVEVGKVTDWYYKLVAKSMADSYKGVERFSKTATFYRSYVDTYKVADYLEKEPSKYLVETVKSIEQFAKTAVFYRDLIEIAIPCDYLSKDVLRNFFDWAVGEHYLVRARGFVKEFTDLGKSLDYICKDVGKALADAGIGTDYLQKTPLKALLDAGKAVDWYSKGVISTILDRVYGEHYPAKDMLKVYVDTSITSDWLVTVGKFVREFTDIGKVSEYISKTPLKALLDTTIVKDIFSRTVSWIKTFEYEAPATGWLTRTVRYYRSFEDAVKGLDWRGAFDILRNFKEFVIIRDQAVRALSVILADTFLGEYWTAKTPAPAVRDKGKPRDLVTKISYTIYGYDVRRVEIVREWLLYERKELIDYILPEDYNVRIDIAKCLLEAMKRLKEKLG